MKPRIFIVAHTHIDAAWLWRWEETVEVCRESFLKVLELMDKYPDLTFVQSSAHYYMWMEEKYPEIFNKIKEKIKEKRWELVLPWVEFDANMPSGESLVRQLTYSLRYFKEKFGVRPSIVWLPDTFGFTIMLPALMRRAGINYFLTQKMRWNDTTVFPYNFFWWESPDGSRVLCHQTLGGYAGYVEMDEVDRMIHRVERRHNLPIVLLMIGYGDHGGGLDDEMYESAVRLIKSPYDAEFAIPSKFFLTLEENLNKGNIPVVRDELYLQYHRGTLVTQSEFKSLFRKAENIIIDAEKICTLAHMLLGDDYPKDQLYKMWITLLFNQFHDILAGSSIEEVYIDAKKELRELIKTCNTIIEEKLLKLANTQRGEDSFLVFNPLPWSRPIIIDKEGYTFIVDTPALGYKTIRKDKKEQEDTVKLTPTENTLIVENEIIKAEIDTLTGSIISLVNKEVGVNLIDKDKGTQILIFKDEPNEARVSVEGGFNAEAFDVWEVYHLQQYDGVSYVKLTEPLRLEVIDNLPNKVSIRVLYKYQQERREDSEFELIYTVYSKIPWLEITFKINWNAEHRFAKFHIPLAFYSEHAIYDQPYGWIKRRNPLSPDATIQERAKYEVCGHKWVDISKTNEVGLSILDDGRYGYSFGGNFIRVSLLRAPYYPPRWGEPWLPTGILADQGEHVFKIALYPHPKDWKLSDTVRRALELNHPGYILSTNKTLEEEREFIKTEGNPILTVLKKAEDDNGYILRLYEANGLKDKLKITFPKNITKANLTDLNEEPITEIKTSENTLSLDVKPHDIITLKFNV